MGLCLIVPAYNEALLVPAFWNALTEDGSLNHFEEVIFVDDGSRDDTYQQLLQVIGADSRAKVVRHLKNRGLGAAIRTGILSTAATHVTWVPIDQSFNIQELIGLAKHWEQGESYIFRRIFRDEAARNLVSWLAHTAFRVVFGTDLRHQSGLFLMSRDTYLSNIPVTQRAISNLELIVRLKSSEVNLNTVEINCHPRIAGESRTFSAKSVLRSVRELLGLIIIEPTLLRKRKPDGSNF